jgi:hypothetical protein
MLYRIISGKESDNLQFYEMPINCCAVLMLEVRENILRIISGTGSFQFPKYSQDERNEKCF